MICDYQSLFNRVSRISIHKEVILSIFFEFLAKTIPFNGKLCDEISEFLS